MQLCVIIILSALLSPLAWGGKLASKDELGCHLDDTTDSYFCDSGPLEGREFLNKQEAEEALQKYKREAAEYEREKPSEELPPPVDDGEKQKPKREVPSDHLTMMSWDMSALGKDGADLDRAALVLAGADIIAIQEMDLHGQGRGFLNVIANLVGVKANEKYCRAWVHAANGERQGFGFVWREKTVGYVNPDGQIVEACGDTGLTIRQTHKLKSASQGTFYFRSLKKMFVVGTIYDAKAGKNPEHEVTEVFRTFDNSKFPVLVAGKLEAVASGPAFEKARKMGFHPALAGKTNIWFRGVAKSSAQNVDLFKRFSDARREDIHKAFLGISPVSGEFAMQEKPEVHSDTLAVVRKPKSIKKKD